MHEESAMCNDIEQRLAELQRQKREINAIIDHLQGAGLQAAQENLANIQAQIAAEEGNLADCRALEQQVDHPTPRAFVGRVKDIYCAKAGKELGEQEPYLLMASVDMLAQAGSVPVTKPAVHCFKVGPWAGLKPGSRAAATDLKVSKRPAFWDLNSRSRTIAAPHDVIFLAGLVEHDGASPEAILGAVHSALEVSILENLNRDYATMASTLANAMTGAIDTFAGAGIGPSHANFDDRMGPVKQLRLKTDDLDTINALGTLEKSLTFKRVKKSGKVTDQYTATFTFEA